MRILIVGFGIQGNKRNAIARDSVVGIVDPLHPMATHKKIEDVPLDMFDAAMLCVPDDPKISLIRYLLERKKHVLVEKPLFCASDRQLTELREIAVQNRVACYTAYNHRFEPHILNMKSLLDSGFLGEVYFVRMFYGNGTARLVRESEWRDSGLGVLPDLGSHLLDTANFWFGKNYRDFDIFSANRFENRSFDHVSFGGGSNPLIQLEVTLLSWKNHFYADVYGENGSAHIDSLCKWGPSTFTIRRRKFPSGKPEEEEKIVNKSDPTWLMEDIHFRKMCVTGDNNLEDDLWMNNVLKLLYAQLPQSTMEQ